LKLSHVVFKQDITAPFLDRGLIKML